MCKESDVVASGTASSFGRPGMLQDSACVLCLGGARGGLTGAFLMKVLFMMSSLQIGGGEIIAVALLPRLRNLGLDITLVTMNSWRDDPELTRRLQASGVPRLDLDARRLFDAGASLRFLGMLRREKYDLIHASDQDTIILGALARRLVGVPAVMTRHVMDEPTFTWKERVRARMVVSAMRRGYDRVIPVSNAVSHHLFHRYGVRQSLLETVHNGLELDRFDTLGQRSQKRAELGWDKDDRVVIMVAMLRRGKGHDILLSAAQEILESSDRVQIKPVGGGALESDLKAQAAKFGARVQFLGERQDVPELLAASDVLVLPSLSEALPTVLLEAGAPGLPVVATDVGGTREIVVEGETGLVVKASDAGALAESVKLLLSDGTLASEMGSKLKSPLQ
ncbi:MAG: hypothetical protein C0524_04345 [Rhodobacter sp.]|nr:hypothetical protein [Rhodobacter sp.]